MFGKCMKNLLKTVISIASSSRDEDEPKILGPVADRTEVKGEKGVIDHQGSHTLRSAKIPSFSDSCSFKE